MPAPLIQGNTQQNRLADGRLLPGVDLTDGGRADDIIFNQLTVGIPMTEDGQEIHDGSLADTTYWMEEDTRVTSIVGILAEWAPMDGKMVEDLPAMKEEILWKYETENENDEPDEALLRSLAAQMDFIEQEAETRERNPAELWDALLAWKRLDERYAGIKESLTTLGWVRPLTATRFEDGTMRFCDGGHRLAAAIELGMTWVPVILLEKDEEVNVDSGTWKLGHRVPKRFRHWHEFDAMEAGEWLRGDETEDDYTDDDYADDQFYMHVHDE